MEEYKLKYHTEHTYPKVPLNLILAIKLDLDASSLPSTSTQNYSYTITLLFQFSPSFAVPFFLSHYFLVPFTSLLNPSQSTSSPTDMQTYFIYKASIPAATTQIPAPITSNAFIAEAALEVA
jgi:hypothetical protein